MHIVSLIWIQVPFTLEEYGQLFKREKNARLYFSIQTGRYLHVDTAARLHMALVVFIMVS